MGHMVNSSILVQICQIKIATIWFWQEGMFVETSDDIFKLWQMFLFCKFSQTMRMKSGEKHCETFLFFHEFFYIWWVTSFNLFASNISKSFWKVTVHVQKILNCLKNDTNFLKISNSFLNASTEMWKLIPVSCFVVLKVASRLSDAATGGQSPANFFWKILMTDVINISHN